MQNTESLSAGASTRSPDRQHFGDVASGHHLKFVKPAPQSIKDGSLKVYDVKLSDVIVSSLESSGPAHINLISSD